MVVSLVNNLKRLGLAALLALSASPAVAQENIVSEVRLGVFAHAAHPGWIPWDPTKFNVDQIEDIAFEVLFRSPDIDAFRWIGAPRPNFGVTVNLDGQESMAHLALTWQTHVLDSPVFIEGTLGAAIHNGILMGTFGKMRPQGCRVQIYTAAGIGIDLNDQFTATLAYEHMSNLTLCNANYGLSNLGIKIGAKFN